MSVVRFESEDSDSSDAEEDEELGPLETTDSREPCLSAGEESLPYTSSGISIMRSRMTNASKLGKGLDRKISEKVAKAEERDVAREAWRGHILLAASISFWVSVFALPEYSVSISYKIFGQRGVAMESVQQQINTSWDDLNNTHFRNSLNTSVREQAVERWRIRCNGPNFGRMYNKGRPGGYPDLVPWDASLGEWATGNLRDIWCGFLPDSYLVNWPNLAQFIIFTVYRNTGSTIHNAVQGFVGTVFTGLNMHLMSTIFPDGARADDCVHAEGNEDVYVVIWYSIRNYWQVRRTETLDQAWNLYTGADDNGGLKARAIFEPAGSINKYAQWFLPGWEDKVRLRFEQLKATDCQPGTMVYRDPQYARFGEIICFLDVALVVFLFLISNSSRNTIMFGLSWHVYFMMNFMNPNLGLKHNTEDDHLRWMMTEYFVVEITTVFGGLIAVLATVMPGVRASNVGKLANDLNTVALDICNIWGDAVLYLTGTARSAKRFQIVSQVDALAATDTITQEHVAGAWWETLDMGTTGRRRRLLKVFDSCALDIKDILYVVKGCVLSENFKGDHNSFMSFMKEPCYDLLGATESLMWVCSSACDDGTIDQDEVEQIHSAVSIVKQRQKNLLDAFHVANPALKSDLSEEQLFMFALSMWARKMTDFTDHMTTMSADGKLDKRETILGSIWKTTKRTWDPSLIFTHGHKSYAFRNWMSIMVTFCIGYFCHASIFDRYSYVMPMTVSLLMVADGKHNVEYEKCTHRLLGVCLGKCLPLMLVGVLQSLDCISWTRLVSQGLCIFLFETFFLFVYFNSLRWDYVACLIAGFSIYSLLAPCGSQDEHLFASKYKELGSLMLAIAIQGFLQAALQRRSPQDFLLEAMRHLVDAFQASVDALWEADFPELDTALKEFAIHLANAKAIAPECDAKLQFVQGRHPPFKSAFALNALMYLDMILAELNMIATAAKDWVPMVNPPIDEEGAPEDSADVSTGVLELISRQPSFKGIRRQLEESVLLVCEVLPDMLASKEHKCNHMQLRRPEQVKAAMDLDLADQLYEELSTASRSFIRERNELTNDLRVRLTILVRSLQNLAQHLGRIEEACIRETRF